MAKILRILLLGLFVLLAGGCDQVTAFVKNMQAPGAFPDDMVNLMTNSVPVSGGRITYPRLAISLTNTRTVNEIGLGPADCGHFKITVWQSNTVKEHKEFDACALQKDESGRYHIDHFANVAYMLNIGGKWQTVEQFGGQQTPDYQAMSVHWGEGPQVAQFFLPPTWLTSTQTDAQARLVETFLAHIGVIGMSVDQRVWFYQIDQAS